MAKQQHRISHTSKPVKQQASSGSNSFTYLVRNFIMVIAFGILFLSVDRMNQKAGQLQEIYQEFQQLRQNGGNQQRLEELYKEIMEAQADTSFIKKLTRGYYWAVHDVAIKGSEYVREIESKAAKPLTREDKLAMRVGVWPLIDYIIKNTPDTAVIYLPEGDSAVSNNKKWDYVYDAEWMEYFLYPRLCLTIGKENEHPDLAKRITHVVIIEGKGYDKLHYDVPMNMRPKEDVLPIDVPKSQPPKQQ